VAQLPQRPFHGVVKLRSYFLTPLGRSRRKSVPGHIGGLVAKISPE
jgi:hypothetical protein